MHFPVLNKRNREIWENQAFWVLLPLRLVAEGKSDANFFIDHFLCILYFFRNIIVKQLLYCYISIFIYFMYGWHIVRKEFHGLKLICIMCGESRTFRSSYLSLSGERSPVTR